MVLTCCVASCKRKATKDSVVSFHLIPKDEVRRKEWIRALHQTYKPWSERKYLRVCSDHFCQTDFIVGGNCKQLKLAALPSVLRSSKFEELQDKENVEPGTAQEERSVAHGFISQRKRRRLLPTYEDNGNVEKDEDLQRQLKQKDEEIDELKRQVKRLQEEIKYLTKENETLKGQRNDSNQLYSFPKFESNSKKTLYYTGFEKYSVMVAVFNFLLPDNSINFDLSIHSKLPAKHVHSFSISAQQQFLLTMFRLKRGFNYETLGDLFNVSKATAGKIFLCWINVMYVRLGKLNIWPHRDVIIKNSPSTFVQKYPNVIGSLDCTEFLIETPSSLVKQSQCYSHYKGATTIKALIMTDPNGAILYMSPLYTGSISDKAIIVQSGFIDILRTKVEDKFILPGDIVLADKGFNVEALFKNINMNINIPTFRVTGTQFTKEEVNWIRNIAHERIHVERAIGRLKQYRILTKKIPVALLGTIEQIYVFCCILTSFRNKLRT